MKKKLFENVGGNQFKLTSDDSVINENLVNNKLIHNTRIQEVEKLRIPDPDHGDVKLSVYPFENTGKWISLPESFKIWEKPLNEIMKRIPLQKGANTHYVTIDSKFFTKSEFLRREGVHADGNFCVDPNFVKTNVSENEAELMKETWGGANLETWGGASYVPDKSSKSKTKPTKKPTKPIKPIKTNKSTKLSSMIKGKETWGGASLETWGGASMEEGHKWIVKEDNSHVKMDWVLPYNIVIPIGDYISETKGGIFTVSTEVGCQGWQGKFEGEVLSEGSFDDMKSQLTDDKKIIFESNKLYFMTSNTPHETLLIEKGKRRTFMRITLNHEYQNKQLKL